MGPLEGASLSFRRPARFYRQHSRFVNAELHEVSVAELRGMPSLSPEDFDQRLDRVRSASDLSWSVAKQRESVIQDLLMREGSMAGRIAAAAEVLGLSPRTVRRLVGQYRVSGQTTSLVAKPPGPHQKRRRLGAVRELIIDEAIETHYLIRPKPPMEEAYRRVVFRCRELGRELSVRRADALKCLKVAALAMFVLEFCQLALRDGSHCWA